MSIEIKDELLDIEGIKNSNKPLIDLFIRRTAVLTSTPESITEKIIRDQWREANRVLQSGTVIGEVDFCNLGTFFISKAKAKKKIVKIEKIQKALLDKDYSDNPKKESMKNTMKIVNVSTVNDIRLKTKLDEN